MIGLSLLLNSAKIQKQDKLYNMNSFVYFWACDFLKIYFLDIDPILKQ